MCQAACIVVLWHSWALSPGKSLMPAIMKNPCKHEAVDFIQKSSARPIQHRQLGHDIHPMPSAPTPECRRRRSCVQHKINFRFVCQVDQTLLHRRCMALTRPGPGGRPPRLSPHCEAAGAPGIPRCIDQSTWARQDRSALVRSVSARCQSQASSALRCRVVRSWGL